MAMSRHTYIETTHVMIAEGIIQLASVRESELGFVPESLNDHNTQSHQQVVQVFTPVKAYSPSRHCEANINTFEHPIHSEQLRTKTVRKSLRESFHKNGGQREQCRCAGVYVCRCVCVQVCMCAGV